MTTRPSDSPPQEDPGRPFETWWESYRDPSFEIAALGPLGAKCREAAGDLIDEIVGGAPIPAPAKRSAARILTCLIYDSYHSDVWNYEEH
jgi:hypothetical protein